MDQRTVNPILPEVDFSTREAINMLRGNIQMSGYQVKAIAFTSSREAEGKSAVSFRLAYSLAALNKKVVFLDCDIRNSKIKKTYRISQKTQGLSEYLCGYASEDELIYHTNEPCFDIIFAGASAPNPSELLSGDRFSALIWSLKSRYDYIILDTPPSNVVVDASLIARQCDSTILVVEYGVTAQSDAVRVKEKLESFGIKIMGVVINKVPHGSGRYGKYGKYGYGYGYGEGHSKHKT
ncbi:MAG: CpsD/CapB family tyrosine-protein kinase [Faecousia sp.]